MTNCFNRLRWLVTWIVALGYAAPLNAQIGKNEEVLFFDGSPGQTRTDTGGMVIYPLGSKQWRFWYQNVYHAAVSPDGRRIAYKYENSINIADVNGQNVKTIKYDLDNASPLAWSPNGDRIAYFIEKELVIIDLDGNPIISHTLERSQGSTPAWSPDGSKIVVSCISPNHVNAPSGIPITICTIDVESGATNLLYEPILIDSNQHFFSESIGGAVWSPKGDQIAVGRFTWEYPDRSKGVTRYTRNLALIPASGGTPRLITDFPEAPESKELPIITSLAWSPDGSELVFPVSFGAGTTPTMDVGLYRIPATGGTLERINGWVPAGTNDRVNYSIIGNGIQALQWTILNPGPKLGISANPDRTDYDVGEEVTVEFKISNGAADPATYTFEDNWLAVDPEPGEGEEPILDIDLPAAPAPFVLNGENPEWTLTIPATAMKPGVLNLRAMVSVEPLEGEPYTLEAEESVLISPLGAEVTITNKRHSWNTTMEADWGERAKAINQQRRMDAQEPYLNLIEFELVVTNNADMPVDNLNVPGVRDVLSYIQSTSEDPAVPLLPIRLYAPDGAEVDLSNPEDPTEVNDVTLEPGESATFAWVVEAFQIDSETREDPYDLKFTPLILGSLSGENIQTTAEETFSIRVRGPIVVNVTSDERDADPNDGVIDVDLEEDGEQISLRAAIEFANDIPGLDRIEFDIPGGGVPTIKVGLPPEGTNVMLTEPDGDLFPVFEPWNEESSYTIRSALKTSDPVEIDGTTQPGGWVELSGELISAGYITEDGATNGLEISGGESEVRGLVINRFPGVGLVVRERGNNLIAGNRIGSDVTGTVALGNGSGRTYPFNLSPPRENTDPGISDSIRTVVFNRRYYAGGILVNSSSNIIGGNKSEDGNIVFGHARLADNDVLPFKAAFPIASEIVVSGSAAVKNSIIGNYIGFDIAGNPQSGFSAAFSYLDYPVESLSSRLIISNGASNTMVDNNIVAQIELFKARNTIVLNNDLGPRFNPTDAGFLGAVIITQSPNTTMDSNRLFSPATLKVYEIENKYSRPNWVNWSTTDIAIEIKSSNNIKICNNIIEGVRALWITDSENIEVTGNTIGSHPPENGIGNPIFWNINIVSSSNIRIGGPTPQDGNTISRLSIDKETFIVKPEFDWTVSGIMKWSYYFKSPREIEDILFVGNNILTGHIEETNLDLITTTDLNSDGLDVIDTWDQDGKQNYPRIAKVSHEGGALRIEGNLDSHVGGASYFLDFYETRTPLPSGHGGASMTYIGRGMVETDLTGFGQYDIQIPHIDEVNAAAYFTATATRVDGGNTSEFSRNRMLNDNFLKELNRAAYGDRNGDGTDDVDQENVASFGAANGADTTIEVSAETSQTNTGRLSIAGSDFSNLGGADLILESVIPETQASVGAPRNYSYSNGVLTFEVLNLEAGASVSVRLILADDATPDTIWVLQSDSTWIETLPAGIDDNQVTLILTDGGSGDRDGEANGRIVAAIGPATALPPLPTLKLEIARRNDSHILSWPLPYNNALLEFSADLTPQSWSPVDFPDPRISDDHWQITLPNPQPDLFPDFPSVPQPSGFYRLRIRE